MGLTVYFATPNDTLIAAGDTSFAGALRRTAEAMDGIQVSQRAETADVVLIDERYEYRTWRYADELARCAFIQRHADRICVLNHDDHARVFLPGLYVSLEKSRPPLIHARPIPYKWDLWKVPISGSPDLRPTHLFAFRGTFHTHPVRKAMHRTLFRNPQGVCEELRKAFHSHDKMDQERYIKEIRNARFSLCPRGLSPSSYRLYESMQLGRCPVVISDDWICPPGPNWGDLALFVPESKVKTLPDILLRDAQNAQTRGLVAYEAWKEFFSWPRRWVYFLDQVKAFHESRTRMQELPELQDIWHSRAFRRCYQWTPTQRARQLLLRKIRALSQSPPPRAVV